MAVTVGYMAPELSDGGQPAPDLAPSVCVPVIRLRTNERQTRVISACAVGLPRIVKYTSIQSIWGHVWLQLLLIS